MSSILALLLNCVPVGYFLVFMISGISQEFQSGDPANKIFFYTTFYELIILIIFCLFLPILNMKLIYENHSFNK